MPNTINPTAIFVPALVVVALTFFAFFRMAAARLALSKSFDMDFYRVHQGGVEPAAAAVTVRHYGNLFELPVLFYAACLTAYVLDVVDAWTLGLAWVFVAARLVQSVVHLTYNNPMHRGGAFILSIFILLALWVLLALEIFARL